MKIAVHFDGYVREPPANSSAYNQCVVARRPSRIPASASVNAAMQIDVMRLVVDTASRKYATVRGEGDTEPGPEPTMSVSKTAFAQRFSIHCPAERVGEWLSSLRENSEIIEALAGNEISCFKCRNRRGTHHAEASRQEEPQS